MFLPAINVPFDVNYIVYSIVNGLILSLFGLHTIHFFGILPKKTARITGNKNMIL